MASDPSCPARRKEGGSLQSGNGLDRGRHRAPASLGPAPSGQPVAAPLRSNLTISYFSYFSDVGPVSLVTSPSCMQILPSRASQTHTQVCRTEVEMRGADGDLWERVRPPLGGAEGAAERDMLGVLAAPPTLTSPLLPCPHPQLGAGLHSPGCSSCSTRGTLSRAGGMGWTPPLTSDPWPGTPRHQQRYAGQPRTTFQHQEKPEQV